MVNRICICRVLIAASWTLSQQEPYLARLESKGFSLDPTFCLQVRLLGLEKRVMDSIVFPNPPQLLLSSLLSFTKTAGESHQVS